MEKRAEFADAAFRVIRRKGGNGDPGVAGHSVSHHEENVSGREPVGGSEDAGAEEPVAQAVAGTQSVDLSVDGEFQLPLDQKQMMIETMPRGAIVRKEMGRAWCREGVCR